MQGYLGEEAYEKVSEIRIRETVYLKNVGKLGSLKSKFQGPYKFFKKFRNFNYLFKFIPEK